MKNCYPIQSCNHFMHRAFLLFASLFIFLFVFSCGTQAYELNGTATGNLLNNGYAAEADGISVYADIDNGYALTLEKNETATVLDDADAQFINICENFVYYVTIDGEQGKTLIRAYDLSSGTSSDIYSAAVADGIKNLFISEGSAWFQSNGNVICLDLVSGETKTIMTDVRAFLPLENMVIYTAVQNGAYGLYSLSLDSAETVLLAKDAVFFDSDGSSVYYSDGKNGLYAVSCFGGESRRIGDGGSNIVCSDGLVYWNNGDEIITWNGDDVAREKNVAEDVTSFAVLSGDDISLVSEEVGEGGVSVSDTSVSAGMPANDYKQWKQFDERWGSQLIGSKTIADVGCAVTSVSIMLVGSGSTAQRYLNNDFDPGIFVKEMNNNGGFIDNLIVWGKVAQIYPGISFRNDNKNFGSLNLSTQSTAVTNHRNLGNYIILGVKNNGHYVAADYGTGDDVYICDPGSSRITKLSEYGKASRAVVYSYSDNGWDGLLKKTSSPVIVGKDVSGGTRVTITCRTSGAKIYYTTDGSDPTTSSKVYTGPFVISASGTVKAIAVYSGYENSDITSQSFVVWKNIYKDVAASDWFYGYVAQATDYGLYSGYEDGSFRPLNNMTRAEFVVALSRFLDIDTENYEHPFTDVGGNNAHWYEGSVAWAYTNKIVAGTSTTTFSPNEKITREQACAIMIRFVDYLEMNLVSIRDYITFVDAANISGYAKENVKRAYVAGILNGSSEYGKLYMHPKNPITRAEAATIMVNFLNLM